MTPPALFQRTRVVEQGHIDRLGHVNNLVWIKFVLELAHAHSTALGFDFDTTAAHGGIWIVHRQEVDYHQPALPGDEILEQTWLSEIRGARSVRQSRFTRQADATKLVSAVTHWAYVDANTLRPRRIDARLLEAYRPLEPAEGEYPAAPPTRLR
jgi:acyl-CoA thioester hydrolase